MTSTLRHVALFALLALAACNRDRTTDRESPSATTTLTGADVVANTTAVTRIADARCARELTCNNVGSDKKYTSHDVCVQRIGVDVKDDLSAKDCTRAVDEKRLDACVAAIDAESCSNPIDKLERLAACRTSALCPAAMTSTPYTPY